MSDQDLSPYLRVIAKTGNTRHPGGLAASDILLSKTNIGTNSRVLDVGCGAGHSTAHVAKTYGCRVIGLDMSKAAIDNAVALYGAGESWTATVPIGVKAQLARASPCCRAWCYAVSVARG